MEKNNKFEKIHLIFSIIVLLWLNAGTFSYVSNYVPIYLRFLLYGIWVIMSILSNKIYAKKLLKLIMPLICFIVLIVISQFFTSNAMLEIYIKNFIYILFITSIAVYYIEKKNKKEQNIILCVLGIDIVYVAINTLINLEINPSIVRFLSAATERQEELLGVNAFYAIGNYAYIYSIIMVLMILFDNLYRKKEKKMVKILFFILFTVLLIKAQFSIALILSIVFLLIIFIENKISNFRIVLLVTPLLIVFFILIVPHFINELSKNEDIPFEIKARIKELNGLFIRRKYE